MSTVPEGCFNPAAEHQAIEALLKPDPWFDWSEDVEDLGDERGSQSHTENILESDDQEIVCDTPETELDLKTEFDFVDKDESQTDPLEKPAIKLVTPNHTWREKAACNRTLPELRCQQLQQVQEADRCLDWFFQETSKSRGRDDVRTVQRPRLINYTPPARLTTEAIVHHYNVFAEPVPYPTHTPKEICLWASEMDIRPGLYHDTNGEIDLRRSAVMALARLTLTRPMVAEPQRRYHPGNKSLGGLRLRQYQARPTWMMQVERAADDKESCDSTLPAKESASVESLIAEVHSSAVSSRPPLSEQMLEQAPESKGDPLRGWTTRHPRALGDGTTILGYNPLFRPAKRSATASASEKLGTLVGRLAVGFAAAAKWFHAVA
ncbi:MAG: hypothetical protein M1817_005369 [Caeruleum heppii]|nr:MAG: hypothetical protein M1817_005369 [Caeruleum heppii]